MEIDVDQLAICLSGDKPHVCFYLSTCNRIAATFKDTRFYRHTCAINGHLYPHASQKILELDL